MPILNIVSTKKMMKILRFLGFELIRIKGSHLFSLIQSQKEARPFPFIKMKIWGLALSKKY